VSGLFHPGNQTKVDNSNAKGFFVMNKRVINSVALAVGGVIITLAFLKMFAVTAGPGWAVVALLTTCATIGGLMPSLTKSPLNTLSFGFSGSLYTCVFLFAYHQTSGPAWGIFALLCGTVTIGGLLVAMLASNAKSPD
jgi:hypothetical protein